MSEYLIIKQTVCEHPPHPDKFGLLVDGLGGTIKCKWCNDSGYVHEYVNLLEVLHQCNLIPMAAVAAERE